MVSLQLDPEYGWVLLAAVATYSIEKWMVSIYSPNKLQATLVRNYDLPTDRLTGVKCRATSVAKKANFLE